MYTVHAWYEPRNQVIIIIYSPQSACFTAILTLTYTPVILQLIVYELYSNHAIFSVIDLHAVCSLLTEKDCIIDID